MYFKMNNNIMLQFFMHIVLIANLVNCVTISTNSNQTTFELTSSFSLACNISEGEDGIKIQWEKDNKLIKDVVAEHRLKTSGDKTYTKIEIKEAIVKDAGNYSCIAFKDGAEQARADIFVTNSVKVKTPSSVNVVEGEKLKIICDIAGSPTPSISWKIINETYTESADRVTLKTDEESKVPNTILIVEDIQMADRGEYTCIGTINSTGKVVEHATMVRVKDKYAALWPFLGICAEVFVLCAIILVYEKKRNKNELEESDTDQSPEQKNIPDQGKESNLRHRQ